MWLVEWVLMFIIGLIIGRVSRNGEIDELRNWIERRDYD